MNGAPGWMDSVLAAPDRVIMATCFGSTAIPPNQPENYVLTGLLGSEKTFRKLEENCSGINQRFGVSRFHASPLNARDGEYKDWDRKKTGSIQ